MKNTTYILINPPILRAERYSSKFLGEAGGSLVPLGILYVASFMENKGCNVEIIDAEHQLLTQNKTVEYVRKLIKPDKKLT